MVYNSEEFFEAARNLGREDIAMGVAVIRQAIRNRISALCSRDTEGGNLACCPAIHYSADAERLGQPPIVRINQMPMQGIITIFFEGEDEGVDFDDFQTDDLVYILEQVEAQNEC